MTFHFYNNSVSNELVTLFSVEPNMSVHKNAFVPMMACESYFHKFNKLKSNVYFKKITRK